MPVKPESWTNALLSRLDEERGGEVSVDEIATFVPNAKFKQRVMDSIRKRDCNNDGKVDVDEARKWIMEIVEDINRKHEKLSGQH
ncbi:unnamed protein product [Echinostoma caproni]|uniref:EF-hand domain-containing protein n=1 Tax=Echinostoma caproni TaxID=27848 RepID=A0A183ACY7_9TREM|nr:unnamed protein product [Echinostoma caproni]